MLSFFQKKSQAEITGDHKAGEARNIAINIHYKEKLRKKQKGQHYGIFINLNIAVKYKISDPVCHIVAEHSQQKIYKLEKHYVLAEKAKYALIGHQPQLMRIIPQIVVDIECPVITAVKVLGSAEAIDLIVS